ncbi:hypothetical protein UPYG_G00046450 [Umbra pygmaea]|uniref:Hydroperoxide isomerase ALOXE3-like n=1 Tax=Umbra pygmaea TaxID=75934 RepID=A0ABD0Y6I4_UMBPY
MKAKDHLANYIPRLVWHHKLQRLNTRHYHCQCFNGRRTEHFIFLLRETPHTAARPLETPSHSRLTLQEHQVRQGLNTVNIRKGAGPDGVLGKVLCAYTNQLVGILTRTLLANKTYKKPEPSQAFLTADFLHLIGSTYRITMVNYKVQLHVGDMLHAGTLNIVHIKLSGRLAEGESTEIKKWPTRGSIIEQQVECPTSLGMLEFVELITKPYLWLNFINDDWFCSKVVVTTPEGIERSFPCYNWLSVNDRHVYREGTGKLIFNETCPRAILERNEELKIRRQMYQWSIHAKGLPNMIKVDKDSPLPDEVRFSFTKDIQFKFTALSALTTMNLHKLASNPKKWRDLSVLSRIFTCHKSKVYEYVENNWMKDEFFGYQFLNGLNPMMIHRCTKLPENLPVTEDMVKPSLFGKTLNDEIQNGNIFLVDYKRLHGVKENVINEKQHYLAAPLCLLYLTPEQKLMPIAIQLKQEPADDNPIFLPTDSEYDWLLAKIFVRSADFVEHELNFHLLRTHLMGEVFAVSTLRNLPMVHPIYKLLISHFRYTLQINTLAREKLISEDGLITKYTTIGGPGITEFLTKAMASLTYSSLCMPEDITARGLESIPNFYYRDDGLKLWDKIHRFVQSVIVHYYTGDSDVKNDSELQKWIKGIFFHGSFSEVSSGIPQSFSTVTELVKFLTMIIFIVSVQHTAVNDGQFDFHGWMPNSPIALQLPPPTTKGQCTEKTMLDTLPDINTTVNGMAAVYLLSKPSTDIVLLGDYLEEHFFEELPKQKIKDFKEELKVISAEIKCRNATLKLPYTYLDPENIETSVAL